MVTGANGFLGAAVARRLIAAGYRVYGLIRACSTNRARLLPLHSLEVVEMASYGVEELREVFQRIQPDYVLHLAAAGVAPGSSAAEMHEGNVEVTRRILQAAAGTVRRVVNTGSCFEYQPCPPGTLMTENWPLQSGSPYAHTKQLAVLLARTLASQLDVPVVTLRPFGVYGPGESPRRLLPSLIHGLLSGVGVDLSPGLQVRDLTYIDDVAEAYLCACQSPQMDTRGGIYNVCSSVPTEIRSVCQLVADELGQPRSLLRFGCLPARPEEAPWIVGDASRFTITTGWKPRFSLVEGVRATVDWVKTSLRTGHAALAG